jgi:hypothetical protein
MINIRHKEREKIAGDKSGLNTQNIINNDKYGCEKSNEK